MQNVVLQGEGRWFSALLLVTLCVPAEAYGLPRASPSWWLFPPSKARPQRLWLLGVCSKLQSQAAAIRLSLPTGGGREEDVSGTKVCSSGLFAQVPVKCEREPFPVPGSAGEQTRPNGARVLARAGAAPARPARGSAPLLLAAK